MPGRGMHAWHADCCAVRMPACMTAADCTVQRQKVLAGVHRSIRTIVWIKRAFMYV